MNYRSLRNLNCTRIWLENLLVFSKKNEKHSVHFPKIASLMFSQGKTLLDYLISPFVAYSHAAFDPITWWSVPMTTPYPGFTTIDYDIYRESQWCCHTWSKKMLSAVDPSTTGFSIWPSRRTFEEITFECRYTSHFLRKRKIHPLSI